MGLQRVINKLLNKSTIGDWRKDRFTGVWPRIEFAGETHVRLWYFEINDHGFHVPQYIDHLDSLPPFSGKARSRIYPTAYANFKRHYRWNNITVSMLELANEGVHVTAWKKR